MASAEPKPTVSAGEDRWQERAAVVKIVGWIFIVFGMLFLFFLPATARVGHLAGALAVMLGTIVGGIALVIAGSMLGKR